MTDIDQAESVVTGLEGGVVVGPYRLTAEQVEHFKGKMDRYHDGQLEVFKFSLGRAWDRCCGQRQIRLIGFRRSNAAFNTRTKPTSKWLFCANCGE
jgi:hypothetical protein